MDHICAPTHQMRILKKFEEAALVTTGTRKSSLINISDFSPTSTKFLAHLMFLVRYSLLLKTHTNLQQYLGSLVFIQEENPPSKSLNKQTIKFKIDYCNSTYSAINCKKRLLSQLSTFVECQDENLRDYYNLIQRWSTFHQGEGEHLESRARLDFSAITRYNS